MNLPMVRSRDHDIDIADCLFAVVSMSYPVHLLCILLYESQFDLGEHEHSPRHRVFSVCRNFRVSENPQNSPEKGQKDVLLSRSKYPSTKHTATSV